MKTKLTNQQIGKTLKLVRELRNYSQDWVADHAGYRDKTTYSRLESGKLKKIDLERFQQICEALHCTPIHVLTLASFETFHFNITCWDDFISSIRNMNETEKQKILEIVQIVFPSKYAEIKEKLSTP